MIDPLVYQLYGLTKDGIKIAVEQQLICYFGSTSIIDKCTIIKEIDNTELCNTGAHQICLE